MNDESLHQNISQKLINREWCAMVELSMNDYNDFHFSFFTFHYYLFIRQVCSNKTSLENKKKEKKRRVRKKKRQSVYWKFPSESALTALTTQNFSLSHHSHVFNIADSFIEVLDRLDVKRAQGMQGFSLQLHGPNFNLGFWSDVWPPGRSCTNFSCNLGQCVRQGVNKV